VGAFLPMVGELGGSRSRLAAAKRPGSDDSRHCTKTVVSRGRPTPGDGPSSPTARW
jgi:hypothetical protein